MRKNAEKMDLSSRNRLLRVPAGSHGFWAHDPLPDPSHDPDVDPRRVTIPLAFTSERTPHTERAIDLPSREDPDLLPHGGDVEFLVARAVGVPLVDRPGNTVPLVHGRDGVGPRRSVASKEKNMLAMKNKHIKKHTRRRGWRGQPYPRR